MHTVVYAANTWVSNEILFLHLECWKDGTLFHSTVYPFTRTWLTPDSADTDLFPSWSAPELSVCTSLSSWLSLQHALVEAGHRWQLLLWQLDSAGHTAWSVWHPILGTIFDADKLRVLTEDGEQEGVEKPRPVSGWRKWQLSASRNPLLEDAESPSWMNEWTNELAIKQGNKLKRNSLQTSEVLPCW